MTKEFSDDDLARQINAIYEAFMKPADINDPQSYQLFGGYSFEEESETFEHVQESESNSELEQDKFLKQSSFSDEQKAILQSWTNPPQELNDYQQNLKAGFDYMDELTQQTELSKGLVRNIFLYIESLVKEKQGIAENDTERYVPVEMVKNILNHIIKNQPETYQALVDFSEAVQIENEKYFSGEIAAEEYNEIQGPTIEILPNE